MKVLNAQTLISQVECPCLVLRKYILIMYVVHATVLVGGYLSSDVETLGAFTPTYFLYLVDAFILCLTVL